MQKLRRTHTTTESPLSTRLQINSKSTPAGIPCQANQFQCANCCWQCWTMRHYGILSQPHALHASTWLSQTQTAIWPTIAFCRLLSTPQLQSRLTLFSKALFIFSRTGTCLLPVSSSYSFWHATYHPLCTPFPQSVMLKMHTLHEELIMANGNATRIAALFQQACIQAPIGNAFFNTTCRLTKPRQLTWVKSCSFAITSDNPFGLILSAYLYD